ncbi:S24 family peptidase [Helicobacter muridarum]|uniref:S24 family peptidase n=1 Tax=Helicobacter muridarum TaxID=216 RepID=UPI00051F8D4F|nr:S24 family peptidase [Helicobacter muridarum]
MLLCLREWALNCDVVIVCGDSMKGIISDGILCFIDANEKSIKNGKVYVISTMVGVFVKQC